jgi:hypothetical protein
VSLPRANSARAKETPTGDDRVKYVRVGAIAGVVGGICIWIYEALVWVEAQHLMPLAGIPKNAVGLVFGPEAQRSLGGVSYLLGTAIHFGVAASWGIVFARIWPYWREKGYEATLLALPFAVVAWIVMHAAIAAVSQSHPNYGDPAVIIGGVMSHLFFTVPLALYVKKNLP